MHQEAVHHGAQVGGDELALVAAHLFLPGLLLDLAVLQGELHIAPFLGGLVVLLHVFALLYGGDGGRIGGGAPDAELFHLLHQAGLAIAQRMLREALRGMDGPGQQPVALAQRRQHQPVLVLLLVGRLDIHLQEAVEPDHFSPGHELLLAA